jgi:hypothetical protein
MFQETLVLTLAYILIVAIAFAPKCPQTVSPVGAVEYFPEIIDDEPITRLPVELNAIATITPLEALPSNELKVIATVATSPVTDLKTLTSKQLKAIARNQKIPKYGSLTKKQLLIALA